jgi:hypothetical protein
MLGHIGFSYIGLIFLLMLFIPNLIWTKKKPQEYTAEGENKILLTFERIGQVLTTCCVLMFSDFNLHKWTNWSWWLVAAIICMVMYEIYWERYFSSERKLADYYRSLFGIPLAGATLPVIAFFLLGVYGKVICMLIATVILGIGHIGIHLQHYNEINMLYKLKEGLK